jgi:hypothetical protein
MSRTHRPDNSGMHQIIHGSQRPYGKCPHCKQTKPMHWISRMEYLCYSCMKKAGKQPYRPAFGQKSASPENAAIEPPTKRQQSKKKQVKQPRAYWPKSIPLRSQKKREITQQPKQEAPTNKMPAAREPRHQRQSKSSGATAETLARWERNRQAVERARQQQERKEP